MDNRVKTLASAFRNFYGRRYDLAYRLNGRDSGLEHLAVLDDAVGRYPETTFNEFIRRLKEGRLTGYVDRVPSMPAIAKIFAEIDRNAKRNQMAPKILNSSGFDDVQKHNEMCLLGALQAGDLEEINKINAAMDSNEVNNRRGLGGFVKIDCKHPPESRRIDADSISCIKEYIGIGEKDRRLQGG